MWGKGSEAPGDVQERQGAQLAIEGTGLKHGVGPKGQFKGFELSPEGDGKTVKGFCIG